MSEPIRTDTSISDTRTDAREQGVVERLEEIKKRYKRLPRSSDIEWLLAEIRRLEYAYGDLLREYDEKCAWADRYRTALGRIRDNTEEQGAYIIATEALEGER